MCDVERRALDALLFEISVTPKPGLVDRRNSGSHADMDFSLLSKSAAIVAKSVGECERLGGECACLSRNEAFARLRSFGVSCEAELLKATGGVNTHRGALFCLGLMAFAMGRLGGSNNPFDICEEAGHICRDTLIAELENREIGKTTSNGERALALAGMTGARGEAAAGFPTVLEIAIPRYMQALKGGKSENTAGVWTLMWLITLKNDTCLFARGGSVGVEYAAEAAEMAIAGGMDSIEAAAERADGEFIKRRLSPGGCADMLIAARFLINIENYRQGGRSGETN